MNIKLEDYCVVCGNELDYRKMIIGQREINRDIPAFACKCCARDYKKHRKTSSWYVIARPCNSTEWQNEDRVYIEIERVYACRYDCMAVPERVRRAA